MILMRRPVMIGLVMGSYKMYRDGKFSVVVDSANDAQAIEKAKSIAANYPSGMPARLDKTYVDPVSKSTKTMTLWSSVGSKTMPSGPGTYRVTCY